MKRNKHRKVGDGYYERAQRGRMLPLPKCGRRVGFYMDCARYSLGEEWRRILEETRG